MAGAWGTIGRIRGAAEGNRTPVLGPREPAGEPSTLQKVPELLFDEPRKALAVAQTRGLHAEGLEVIGGIRPESLE